MPVAALEDGTLAGNEAAHGADEHRLKLVEVVVVHGDLFVVFESAAVKSEEDKDKRHNLEFDATSRDE